MSPDYTLPTLLCWDKDCPATFDDFTGLSNHHLTAHERDLHGASVAVWLARDGTPAAPIQRCTCGCVYTRHQGITAEAPLQPCGACSCRAFVLALARDVCPICQHRWPIMPFCSRCGPACVACAAERQRREQWDATAPGCVQCQLPVPDDPDNLRLRLCAACICAGLLAHCEACGASWPEHGPGGRGCATWLQAPDEPVPGLGEETPGPLWRQHTNNPTHLTALRAFWRACVIEHLPFRALDARLLLDTFGVPPDAPAGPWEAAIAEAVEKWKANQGGTVSDTPP